MARIEGVGKSSLFDAFGFLADCLKLGVEDACDAHGRGGFQRIRSQGSRGPIEFEVYYRQDSRARPITYELTVDVDRSGRPYVASERLRQRHKGQHHGQGFAWKGGAHGPEEPADFDELTRHPCMSSFRKFVEGWYLSYFSPNAARSLPLVEPQRHQSVHSDNLGNVVQFMEGQHSRPENGLHHKLLEVLAREMRAHASRARNASQIFVTTYQPYFVDALGPKETWILERGADGFATIRRASDDPIVESMVNEGLPLGSLWYSDYLD